MADAINFLTTNDATDAFQKGRQLADQSLMNDANLEAKQQSNLENKLSQGSRLRSIDAAADSAVAGADVAKGTVGSKIADSANAARTSGATADVAQGTVGAKIADANNQARSTGAAADVAVGSVPDKLAQSNAAGRTALSNAGVVEQTAPDRVQQSRDQTRSGAANADVSQMQTFDKVMGYIKAGDIEGARAYSLRSGANVPDAVFSDAEVQKHLTDAWQKSKDIYPDRPRDQLTFVQGYLKHMADTKGAISQPGVRLSDAQQSAGVFNVPDAPEAPATKNTVKWGTTGTDSFGNHTYGWINADAQTVAPGSAANQPPNGAAGATQTAYGPLGDPTKTGEEYLKTIKPEDVQLIRGLANNEINPNSLSIKGGHREQLLKMAKMYDPTYDQTKYVGNSAYARTSGSAGSRIELASNEVEAALPLALEASRNLPRDRFMPWNELKQRFLQKTSDPAYNDFALKNFALINAYTRAMNPQGVPRIAERMEQHANGILSLATSNEAYEVQARALWQEVQRSRMAVAKARESNGPKVGDIDVNAPMPTLQPRAAAPGGVPARPSTVPEGSAYSPSRGMWRDPSGNIYGPDGTPARN